MVGSGIFQCQQRPIARNVLSFEDIFEDVVSGVGCARDVGKDTASSSAR